MKKRPTTALEDLIASNPNLEYDSGMLFQGENLVEIEGDQLISEFYSDFDEFTPSGRDYIARAFFNDYAEAFKQVYSYTRILD